MREFRYFRSWLVSRMLRPLEVERFRPAVVQKIALVIEYPRCFLARGLVVFSDCASMSTDAAY